jgi:hypothetical protein
MMMIKPSKIIRTTLGEFREHPDYSDPCVYVISCYPSIGCLYIGETNNLRMRLNAHYSSKKYTLRRFLHAMDAHQLGLDILVPPDGAGEEWRMEAESRLIERFHPLCNTSGLGEVNRSALNNLVRT